MKFPIWQKASVVQHSHLIAYSYNFWMSKDLFPGITDNMLLSEALYHAPFIVVSHGTEKDPVFNYANLSAQKLWKIDWEDFIKMPSSYPQNP